MFVIIGTSNDQNIESVLETNRHAGYEITSVPTRGKVLHAVQVCMHGPVHMEQSKPIAPGLYVFEKTAKELLVRHYVTA